MKRNLLINHKQLVYITIRLYDGLYFYTKRNFMCIKNCQKFRPRPSVNRKLASYSIGQKVKSELLFRHFDIEPQEYERKIFQNYNTD